MRLTLIIFLFPLAFGGCSTRSSDSPPIEEQRFVHLYADKLALEEEGRLRSLDSLGMERGLDSLYRAHQITREEAARSTAYYQADLGRWGRLQELVGKRLEELSKADSPQL